MATLTWVYIDSSNGLVAWQHKDISQTNHKCWLIKGVLWHWPESNSTRSIYHLNPQHVFGDHTFTITFISPNRQWVKWLSLCMDSIICPVDSQIYGDVKCRQAVIKQWSSRTFYQLVWMIILAIFLYIAYVYNQIFSHPNGIFTHLGWVDIDFFYLC